MTTPTEQSIRKIDTAKYLVDESDAREALAVLPEAVRQRLDAWQTAQSDWFRGTVLEIVAEYIAWDDARRIEAEQSARAETAEAKVAVLRDELRMAIAIISIETPHAPMLANFRQALQETANG